MTVRGAGTLRQRRPGSWEVRFSVGPDPVSGRAVNRHLLLSARDELEAATLQFCIDRAGIGFIRLDD